MKSITVALFLCILTSSFYAGDITTKSGKQYFDIRINKITPKGIQIFHKYGVSIIKLDDLSDDLKKDYEDQIQKLAEESEDKMQKEQEEKRFNKEIKKITERFFHNPKIYQIVDDGVLCQAKIGSSYKLLFCQDLPKDIQVEGEYLPDNTACFHKKVTHRKAIIVYQSSLITKCLICQKQVCNKEREGYPKLKEPERWLELYNIGKYIFIDTNNAKRTFPRYTYSKEKAIDYLKRKAK